MNKPDSFFKEMEEYQLREEAEAKAKEKRDLLK